MRLLSRAGLPAGTAVATAVPLLLLLAVFVVWGARDGGYSPLHWLPGALFALGLVAVLALGAPDTWRRRRTLLAAALFLLAFTVWSYLSIEWAHVRGDALDGANRTLLYLCVFAAFAWRPIRSDLGLALLGGYSLAIACVGGVAFWRTGNVEASFIAGRLATPISYPNANAALFLVASIPPVVLASRREVPPVVRAVLLPAAGVLAELALLCQSRASVVALPLAALVLVALTPRRVSLTVAISLTAVPVALATHRLLAVYPAVTEDRNVAARLADVRAAVLWTVAALAAAGLVVAVVDRRLVLQPAALKALRVGAAVAAVCAIVAGIAVFVVVVGSPMHEAAAAWNRFKEGDPVASSRESHLLSGVGSPRYDIWRVALDEFTHSPIRGVGVDNFATDYLLLRRTKDEPLYPHSLELRLLAQTGIVGTLLFAGFLAAALAAALRAWRRAGASGRAVVGTSLAAFTYWFVHGSVDWLWEFPALAAPAVAWLGLAARTAPAGAHDAPAAAPPPRSAGVLRVAVPVAAAAAAAVLVAPAWLAAHEVDAAAAGWRRDPQLAFRRFDLASRLNPLSDTAALTEGVIALHIGDALRARRSFAKVLERNPYSWFAHLQLALLDSQQGLPRSAREELARAQRLDPREIVLAEAVDDLQHGKRLEPSDLDEQFLNRTKVLTGTRQH